MPHPVRPVRIAVPVLLLAATLAGCTGSGQQASSAAGSGGVSRDTAGRAAGPQAARPLPSQAGAAAAGAGGQTGTKLVPLARPATDPRSVVYTVQLTVRARNVDAAAGTATGIATGAGGYVRSLTSGGTDSGRNGTATLVLALPPAALEAALVRLRGLGRQLSFNREADDVTDAVVDVAARLSAQRASVARIRTLMSRARTVGEVVSVEDQLTRREADLESLQTRQQALDRQVSLSTVTLTLVPPSAAGPADNSTSGFLAGLRSGWTAFTGAIVVALTVLGAVLPFVVLLALAVAAGLLVRRATARRRPPPAPAGS